MARQAKEAFLQSQALSKVSSDTTGAFAGFKASGETGAKRFVLHLEI